MPETERRNISVTNRGRCSIPIDQDPHAPSPGTGFTFQIGEGKGRGYTANLPMPQRAGDQSYQLVFDEGWDLP